MRAEHSLDRSVDFPRLPWNCRRNLGCKETVDLNSTTRLRSGRDIARLHRRVVQWSITVEASQSAIPACERLARCMYPRTVDPPSSMVDAVRGLPISPVHSHGERRRCILLLHSMTCLNTGNSLPWQIAE